MDPVTLRFLLVVLAAGATAIGVGFAWTRMRERAADEALAAPPDRPVPGLAPELAAPTYVPAHEALAPRVSHALPHDARTEVCAAIADAAPVLDAGWADPRLVTDPASGLVVLDDARVALLPEGLGNVREYLGLVARAGAHPLVVVTADVDADVLDAVVANLARGHRSDTIVRADANAVTGLAGRLATRTTSRGDLQSGWIPRLPAVDRFVADEHHAWILVGKPSA